MKKTFIVIIIMMMLFTTGCDELLQALEEYETTQEENTTLVTTMPADTHDIESNALYDGMPILPNLNFSNMDLFDDGYQVVEFDYAPDGDTAIFVIGSSYFKTRFLGVDTMEMSTDSGAPEPWAKEAKEFTNDILESAREIVLELDENSNVFDNYDRLLAWIWVDGQLLNYMLAARGYADVKYLYDDYKYNDDLLDAEHLAQSNNLGVWGDDEPYYNPDDNISTYNSGSQDNYISIKNVRNLPIGSKVKVKGIVTNSIQNNAFIEDETGGIYVYTNNKSFSALTIGNEIIIEGELSDYNGLLEIVNFNGSGIRIISQNNIIAPKSITLSQISEELEGQYVEVANVEITFVEYKKGEKGYSIYITKDGVNGEIRIDKHLINYPDPESFKSGDKINVVGNISQHYDTYQILISDNIAITYP